MRARLLRVVRLLAFTFALLWLAAVAALWWFQRDLVFPGHLRPADALPADLVRFGDPACVARERPASPGAPVVVFFHGNGEHVTDLDPVLSSLSRAGFHVFAPEYPGYGHAPGEVSEASILACVQSLSARLDRLSPPPSKRFVIGHSLGTGAASAWAVGWPLDRLVLLAPYTSIAEMAAPVAPWAPVTWLVRDRFDTLSRAGSIRVPTLVVHGEFDDVVPFEQGRRVAAGIPGATFRAVAEGDHYPFVPMRDEIVAFLQGGAEASKTP